MVYGDSQNGNLWGEIYQHYDQAGLVTFEAYNIQNQVLKTERRLLKDYKREVNWGKTGLLEDETFQTAYTYNAFGQIVTETTPDRSVYKAAYDTTEWLKKVDVTFSQPSETTKTFVENIEYNASGQRSKVKYGNGVVTKYTYEPKTLRLIKIHSTRPPCTKHDKKRPTTLQNITYTHDPVGNITRIEAASYKTFFPPIIRWSNRCATTPTTRCIDSYREPAGNTPAS